MCEYKIEDLTCSLSLQLYNEPVVASDGHTYEKQLLKKIFYSDNCVSPLTREKLTKTYVPNLKIRSMVRAYIEKYPEKKSEQYIKKNKTNFNNMKDFLDYNELDINNLLNANSIEYLIEMVSNIELQSNENIIYTIMDEKETSYTKNILKLIMKHNKKLNYRNNMNESYIKKLILNNHKFSTDDVIKFAKTIYKLHGLSEFDAVDNNGVPNVHCLFDSTVRYSHELFNYFTKIGVNFNIRNTKTKETTFMYFLLNSHDFSNHDKNKIMDYFVEKECDLYYLSSKEIKEMTRSDISEYIVLYMRNMMRDKFDNDTDKNNMCYMACKIIDILTKIKKYCVDINFYEKMFVPFTDIANNIILFTNSEIFEKYHDLLKTMFGESFKCRINIIINKNILPSDDTLLYMFNNHNLFEINQIEYINIPNKTGKTLAHYIFAEKSCELIKLFIKSKLSDLNKPDNNNIFPCSLLMNRCLMTEKLFLHCENNEEADCSNAYSNNDVKDLFNHNKMVNDKTNNIEIVFNKYLFTMASSIKYNNDISISKFLMSYFFPNLNDFFNCIFEGKNFY